MAKVNFDVAAAFAPQAGEGEANYDPTLDAVAASLSGDPDGTDDGLLLGDPSSGIGESGLTLTLGRRHTDKAPVAGSFTRPVSDWLALESRGFSFAFPWVGPKRTVSTPKVDADFVPLRGVVGILNAFGLVGSAWGAGVGHSLKFGAANPCSALLYYFGNRLELADCRGSSLVIAFRAGEIPIATANFEVGSVKSPKLADVPLSPSALPALDYGAQATESALAVESVGFAWGAVRGFQELTLTITPSVEELGDSNALGGTVREQTGRVTTIEATLYADDAGSNEVFELQQLLADAAGDLSALAFQVGVDAVDGGLARSTQVIVASPELDEKSPVKLGSKGGHTISLIARAATANQELELVLR